MSAPFRPFDSVFAVLFLFCILNLHLLAPSEPVPTVPFVRAQPPEWCPCPCGYDPPTNDTCACPCGWDFNGTSSSTGASEDTATQNTTAPMGGDAASGAGSTGIDGNGGSGTDTWVWTPDDSSS